jgi:predicted transcriptional regulator
MLSRFRSDVLRRELAVRGLTGYAFAELAGLTPETLSRILGGRPVNTSTVRAIVSALARVPVLAGADKLIEMAT